MDAFEPALADALGFFEQVLLRHRVEKHGEMLVCACGCGPTFWRRRTPPPPFDVWHPRHVRSELSLALSWKQPLFLAEVPPVEVNLLHARDIPDLTFLAAVQADTYIGLPAQVYSIRMRLQDKGFQASTARSGQLQDSVPMKLVRAKARRLIRRGLVRTWGGWRELGGDSMALTLTHVGRELLVAERVAA